MWEVSKLLGLAGATGDHLLRKTSTINAITATTPPIQTSPSVKLGLARNAVTKRMAK